MGTALASKRVQTKRRHVIHWMMQCQHGMHESTYEHAHIPQEFPCNCVHAYELPYFFSMRSLLG